METNEQQQIKNSIQIGDIVLISSDLSMDKLISKVTLILKNPVLKDYLGLLETKKICGGNAYLG